jgi:hypothetical protein
MSWRRLAVAQYPVTGSLLALDSHCDQEELVPVEVEAIVAAALRWLRGA